MNLSTHFTLEELTVSQSASRLGIDNSPTAQDLANLRELAQALEQVRALLGRPLLITSGYRSRQLNQAIGGAAHSAHMLGYAADFISPPQSPLDICHAIARSPILFDQLIQEHDWVHFAISTTNRRQLLTFTGGGYAEGIA
jgi:zinc D-Ala-D-Ala carboxypeptidase